MRRPRGVGRAALAAHPCSPPHARHAGAAGHDARRLVRCVVPCARVRRTLLPISLPPLHGLWSAGVFEGVAMSDDLRTRALALSDRLLLLRPVMRQDMAVLVDDLVAEIDRLTAENERLRRG